jgi:ferredoxin
MPKMRIEADTDMCASSGMCALTVPELFDQSDEDGTVVLLQPVPTDTQIRDVEDAVRRCPSGALKLTD